MFPKEMRVYRSNEYHKTDFTDDLELLQDSFKDLNFSIENSGEFGTWVSDVTFKGKVISSPNTWRYYQEMFHILSELKKRATLTGAAISKRRDK